LLTKVLDRFHIKSRDAAVIVLHERGKIGDRITDGTSEWEIVGVETYCIPNPPLPWGFMLKPGERGPEVGADVSIVKGPNHDATPWPRESESVVRERFPATAASARR
jgi:hypothetical protein